MAVPGLAVPGLAADVKEAHGAGQPQLRNLWANIGAWPITLWLHTLVELWAWDRPHEELVDRSDSPWDREPRRASHADRCKAVRRECIRQQLQHRRRRRRLPREILVLIQALARRAV